MKANASAAYKTISLENARGAGICWGMLIGRTAGSREELRFEGGESDVIRKDARRGYE